jgi:hypothetical protein
MSIDRFVSVDFYSKWVCCFSPDGYTWHTDRSADQLDIIQEIVQRKSMSIVMNRANDRVQIFGKFNRLLPQEFSGWVLCIHSLVNSSTASSSCFFADLYASTFLMYLSNLCST